MHVAIVGCGHGQVDKIYEVIAEIEKQREIKVQLVLCCGDFQSVRNMKDLRCMACPIKYQEMHDFHRYYSGEKTAPILTLFIGGNHEASNYLQELPYGGWVAPNIFYMGYSGCVKFGPLRIAGISGIFKGRDYNKGRFETPPYDQQSIRSVYHYRNLDTIRLRQLSKGIDIFLSHDWPRGIENYGDLDYLLCRKPFFRNEIANNELGSEPLEQVLNDLRPSYWFSAHMHVKYGAIYPFEDTELETSASTSTSSVTNPDKGTHSHYTRFLALDKVLPRRQFLQVIEFPCEAATEDNIKLQYDPEWLAILKRTDDNLLVINSYNYIPSSDNSGPKVTEADREAIVTLFENNLDIPQNFVRTVDAYRPGERPEIAFPVLNPQTTDFITKLNIRDPIRMIKNQSFVVPVPVTNPNEIIPNPDEISLDFDDDALELPVTDSMAAALPPRSKLQLPPPKSDSAASEKMDEVGLDDEAKKRREADKLRILQTILSPGPCAGPDSNTSFVLDCNPSFDEEPLIKRRRNQFNDDDDMLM